MARFERVKRVTDPLDDKVKARLVGMDLSYISSGSEHDGVEEDDSSSSSCLSDLAFGFLEEHNTLTESNGTHSDSENADTVTDPTDAIEELVKQTVTNNADSVRNLLLLHVSRAIEVFSCLRANKSVLRRNVMAYLRNLGHNAAICKSKWESSGGLTAGNYEYIDVIVQKSATCQNRYIVDVDFAGEFEIARPSEQYSRIVRILPRAFVGRGEDLKRIVKVMCDAAKRSLKSKDLLHLPPWRKNRYMQMKWFGPYRRTTSHTPEKMAIPAPISKFTVECRSVGFVTGVSNINNSHNFVRTR